MPAGAGKGREDGAEVRMPFSTSTPQICVTRTHLGSNRADDGCAAKVPLGLESGVHWRLLG